MQFTDSEHTVLTNALYTAADRYRECAKVVGDDPAIAEAARKSLAATFEKQAADCAALLEKLEG